MPDVGGTYQRVRNWVNDANNGIDIEASLMDTEDDSIATALNNRLMKDGANSPTANLPMGGFKHTGVANGTARNHYAALGQVQDSGYLYAGSGGSANAYTLTLVPAITAYAAGQLFSFKASFANTGAATLAVNGLAATALKKFGDVALQSGDIQVGDLVLVQYDGTNFQLVGAANANNALNGESLYFDSDKDTYFATPGDDNLDLYVGGTKIVDFLATGLNLTGALAVTGAGSFTGVLSAGALQTEASAINVNSAVSNSEIYFQIAGVDQMRIGLLGGANSFRVRDDVAGVDRLVVDTSGNVGINTASPAALGHLYSGASGAASAGSTILILENSATEWLQFRTPNTALAGILFGDPEDGDVGQLRYDHANDEINLRAGAAASLTIGANSVAGTVVATNAECDAGTLTDHIVTPSGLEESRKRVRSVVSTATAVQTLSPGTHAGALLIYTGAGAATWTVDTGWTAGDALTIIQAGAGQITLVAGTAVLNNRNGLKSAGQDAMMTVAFEATGEAYVGGDTTT